MTSVSAAENDLLLRWEMRFLVVGLVALLISAAGAFLGGADQFFRAYFAACVYFLGLSLGGMALLMLWHMTGGAWGYLVRRVFEAQMKTLPLLLLLFIPLAFGVEHLYLWAQPKLVAVDRELAHQQFYLNRPFFLVRAAIYFAIWLLIAAALAARSRQQERTGAPILVWKFQRLSEVGLVLYGTTLHFAAFDWLETLQSTYHSTIFPFLVVSSQLVSAQAFAIVAFILISLRREAAAVVSTRALIDLGTILLAFLIIWAYMLWFQFMLGWIGDLSSDALWFMPRSRGGWYWVCWALGILGFGVPFFLLLMRSVKSRPTILVRVAGVVLFMQLVFAFYLVVPVFPAPSLTEHWMEFVTPFGVGGVWLAWFLDRLRRQPVLPPNDLNRESALHLRNMDEEDFERERALVPDERIQ